MEKLNCTNTMLCWNPGGEVALVTDHLCDRFTHHIQAGTRRSNLAVSVVAMLLIHRDGCDPDQVDSVMLGLEEYWNGCVPDTKTRTANYLRTGK